MKALIQLIQDLFNKLKRLLGMDIDAGNEANLSNTETENMNKMPLFNTLSFSTDMSTLYLVRGKRAIRFPLKEGEGIVIGLLKNQITVDTDPTPTTALVTNVTLPFKKTQWQIMFDPTNKLVHFIGASEIEIDNGDDIKFKSQHHFFDVSEKAISLKRVEDGLEVTHAMTIPEI